MKIFIFFLVLNEIFRTSLSVTLNETCIKNITETLQKYFLKEQHETDNVALIEGFDKYSDILLSCNAFYDVKEIDEVYLYPKYPLLIDDSLKLEKMFHKYAITSFLFDFTGIEVYKKREEAETVKPLPGCCISFYSGILDFYLNERIMTNDECREEIFYNLTNVFQPFKSVRFRNVIFPKTGVCMSLFNNSQAKVLFFGRMINSLLISNRLNFIKTNSSGMKRLKNLFLEMSFESVTQNFLQPNMFPQLESLILIRDVWSIEFGLFKQFKRLRLINFIILNLRKLIHVDKRWLSNSFDSKNVNLSDEKSIDLDIVRTSYKVIIFSFESIWSGFSFDKNFVQPYNFPSEDLCLFKEFPHSQLILPIIVQEKELNCTCTIKWLQMYYHIYSLFLTLTKDYAKFIDESNLLIDFAQVSFLYKFCKENEIEIECDFVNLFHKCEIENVKYVHEITDDDVYMTLKWLQFILLTLLQPLFGLIGLINNTLVLITIRHKEKEKLFKDKMYKHLQINALFNIFYSLLMIFALINTCIAIHANSLYCSMFYTSIWAQYFKIIVQNFLGNVLAICVNVSYLFFSFSRLIEVSNLKERKFFEKFQNLNLKI